MKSKKDMNMPEYTGKLKTGLLSGNLKIYSLLIKWLNVFAYIFQLCYNSK